MNFIKKLFGKKDPNEPIFAKKLDNASSFLSKKFAEFLNDFETLKHKLSNLRETNYKLGLLHLEKGNISDAVFRFKFMKKFWPNCYDAHYQLAYCLTLEKKLYQAREVLNNLLEIEPNYDIKAQELLNKINVEIKQQNND